MAEFRLETQSIRPNVGMDQQEVHQCGDVLSKLFADQWVLATKSLNCKHNVLGKRREMLKDLFKVINKNFIISTEITAKELRNLGFRVPHLPEMLELTRISPSPRGEKWPDADTMVSNLLEDVERVIQVLYKDAIRFDKQDIKAPDVEDFLEDTLRNHKEIAKKLRCHLEQKGGVSGRYGGGGYGEKGRGWEKSGISGGGGLERGEKRWEKSGVSGGGYGEKSGISGYERSSYGGRYW
ncbi:Glycine-rich cell wall structural protein-like [Balamuthia mandrillaris]